MSAISRSSVLISDGAAVNVTEGGGVGRNDSVGTGVGAEVFIAWPVTAKDADEFSAAAALEISCVTLPSEIA